MTDDRGGEVVVRPDGELVVAVSQEGILVDGDDDVVASYLDRIRETAGKLMAVAGVSKGSVGSAIAVGGGAATAFAQHGQFVQLSAKSMEAIRAGKLIPGDPGFFRMTTLGEGGKFLEQLQWRPATLDPVQLLSVQMIAAQMALKMAIAEVNESIKRVEGKVETILKLVEANRVGDVMGHHATVERMVRALDRTGVLPATDWDSVASLGPDLIVVIERLRAHIRRTLDDFKPSAPIQERAETLKRAVEDGSLGESLNLLILAEESLYKWQRLRLARVKDVEQEHVQQVVDDVFDLLATQVKEDGQLYIRSKNVLESYRRTSRIDGFRFWSVSELAEHSTKLQQDLDAFAQARRNQLAEWRESESPSVLDAATHVVEIAGDYTSRALEAAGTGISSVYDFIAGGSSEDRREAIRRDIRSRKGEQSED